MLQDGWKGPITNVDFSSVVIEQMKTKYDEEFLKNFDHKPELDFVCTDITEGLPFEDKSFDLIICKGTFDAILCSDGSVANIKTVVSECSRVLATGHGILFLVSHGNVDSRIVFLEHDNDIKYYWEEWDVKRIGRKTQSGTKCVTIEMFCMHWCRLARV